MQELLSKILSGKELSNRNVAAYLDANWENLDDWEKYNDACFLIALDKQLVENLLEFSDKIETLGPFSVILETKNIPGANIILEYKPENNLFNKTFQEYTTNEIKEALRNLNPHKINSDTSIEISKNGIGFKIGDNYCSVYLEKQNLKNHIDRIFEEQNMGM